MLKSTQLIVLTALAALVLVTTAKAQVLLGSFQGTGDPTDAGWVNPNTGHPITTDPADSFVAAGVPGYPESLQVNGIGFGGDSVQLQFSPAQISAFYNNSWITFTFSVPGGTYTGGYSQIYNLALNAPGYGYNNLSWANAVESGATNNTNPGSNPTYYFNNGTNSLRTMVVSINYSSVEPAIQAGIANSVATNGPSYLQMTFQGNLGGGAPTNILLNSVVLSQGPFGQVAPPTANIFIVDDFSTNGVGPENPTNDDYYTTTNVYEAGQITNVWANWFGGAFSNVVWSSSDAQSNSASGALQINLDWTPGSQFVVWEQGPANNNYTLPPTVSSLTYTSLECDVRWDPSSVNATGTVGYATFGPLRFGARTSSYGQDWILTTNIPASDTNWTHIVVPLALTDPNLQPFPGILIGADSSTIGSPLNGPATLYVDNVKFVGPLIVPPPPPAPKLSIQAAKPGLRMFVGSSASYIREGVITKQGTGESESWVGAGVNYPVNYSFQLLSYPPTNILTTELAIVPEASFNPTSNFQTTIYGNPFLDYQVSNGLYVSLSPRGGGAVTAVVQWKVGLPSANAASNVLTLTNTTAIGTWTLSMSSATAGTLTAPGGGSGSFTINDPNVASDFANPAVAIFFEDPNTAAGYGLYEDIGTISITGTASGNQTENFANETADFASNISPGGYFQNNYSADPGNLVITRNGLDAYWISWTTPVPTAGFGVVESTNLTSSPLTWVDPPWYSGNSDFSPPRANDAVEYGTKYWTLIPYDDLPTVDGNAQPSPPAITDPLAPDVYFIGSTNSVNQYP
ncbi:MAG TPA: hypothetical protein VGY98_15315 [Verrucomicrobiae bacterium]|nr:hypothetical protein [Verrucomicrobiae bacterium]